MTELTLEDLDLSEEAFGDNGGWGLHIVQAMSAKCGVTADPAGGKWVAHAPVAAPAPPLDSFHTHVRIGSPGTTLDGR